MLPFPSQPPCTSLNTTAVGVLSLCSSSGVSDHKMQLDRLTALPFSLYIPPPSFHIPPPSSPANLSLNTQPVRFGLPSSFCIPPPSWSERFSTKTHLSSVGLPVKL